MTTQRSINRLLGGRMADDRQLLTELNDDLPRRVRGVNWLVPGQPPPPRADAQLPKRVPGSSSFRPAPRRARLASQPVIPDKHKPHLAVPPPAAAPAATPRAAQLPPHAAPRRKPPRARAWRWFLPGLLVAVIVVAGLIAMIR